MLGQHPLAYGVPELNLFMAETMDGFWSGQDLDGSRKAVHWPLMRHGLLRTIAQLYAGEQTIEAVRMARRWILHRGPHSSATVFQELQERVAPLMLVEKSPGYLAKPIYLRRLAEACPNARFIHLVRHPVATGESILNTPGGRWVLWMSGAFEQPQAEPFPEPQYLWHDTHLRIMEFLDEVPAERWRRLRGEDLLQAPVSHLTDLCSWLGLAHGESELAAMQHPEASPFACMGPINARLGNDPNFLRAPQLREGRAQQPDLDAPLAWRPDGQPLYPEVLELAAELGYSA